VNIEFNWIAILTATIAGTVVAGIWYSKLFGKSWRELTGVTEADSKIAGKTPILILVVSNFITTLGMGFILNQLQPESDLSKFIFSILISSIIWLSFSATTLMTNNTFELKPKKLTWINIAYQFTLFIVIALTLTFFS